MGEFFVHGNVQVSISSKICPFFPHANVELRRWYHFIEREKNETPFFLPLRKSGNGAMRNKGKISQEIRTLNFQLIIKVILHTANDEAHMQKLNEEPKRTII